MPENWQDTTLGEVAKVISERADPRTLNDVVYVGLEHLVTGSWTLSNWGSSSEVSSSTTPFLEGDTLFGRLRPYLRKGCVAPFAGVCTPEILVIRSEAGVDSRFLGLLVLNDAIFEECNRLSAGSRMPRTSATDLKGLSVLVPPLDEQRRIVDLVGSIDTYIDSLETQIEATRTARSALLSELLSNAGDDWQETTLGDLCDLEIGRTPPRKEARYWTNAVDRPFCTIADMAHREVFPNREGVTELAEQSQKARRVVAGTLLMSFKLTIGRVGFAGCDLFPNEAIVAIRPEESRASSEFLYLNLGSRDLTEGSGQAVKGKTLNSTSLRQIPLQIPPLQEQWRIVDLVGSVDDQIAALESQVESGRAFRSGVLSELLSGERLLDESYDVAVGL